MSDDEERERFEAWADSVHASFDLGKLPDGRYLDYETGAAWQAWQAARAWQPIATAPHETEVLLGWMNEWSEPNEWRCEIGCATSGRDWPAPDGGRFSSYSMHGSATHWMPLPEPPEAES